ncbi:hypothetical protein Tco_1345890 [Tanacetum coccineum]
MALTDYADADHAGCQDTRRSTSGSAQFLGDNCAKSMDYGFTYQIMALHTIAHPMYVTTRVPLALCCNNKSMANVNKLRMASPSVPDEQSWLRNRWVQLGKAMLSE